MEILFKNILESPVSEIDEEEKETLPENFTECIDKMQPSTKENDSINEYDLTSEDQPTIRMNRVICEEIQKEYNTGLELNEEAYEEKKNKKRKDLIKSFESLEIAKKSDEEMAIILSDDDSVKDR